MNTMENYNSGVSTFKEDQQHYAHNDKIKRCISCGRAFEAHRPIYAKDLKPDFLPDKIWKTIPLIAGECWECEDKKFKIPDKLSAQMVTILMSVDRTTYLERETFFEAYQYDRKNDRYNLVDAKLANTIKTKLKLKLKK